MTLIRVPPHCDFEQGTGHYHEGQEELYLVTRGTLTMRFGDEIRKVGAGSVARIAPRTRRSHRNEGDEPVEMWAVSRRIDEPDAVKIDDFWEASPDAAQELPPGSQATITRTRVTAPVARASRASAVISGRRFVGDRFRQAT